MSKDQFLVTHSAQTNSRKWSCYMYSNACDVIFFIWKCSVRSVTKLDWKQCKHVYIIYLFNIQTTRVKLYFENIITKIENVYKWWNNETDENTIITLTSQDLKHNLETNMFTKCILCKHLIIHKFTCTNRTLQSINHIL